MLFKLLGEEAVSPPHVLESSAALSNTFAIKNS